jgi:glycerol 2-dehydrogenase (NADP+)
VTAYSPLGSTGSPLMKAEQVVEVANRRGVSPATVLLSWHSAYPPLIFFLLYPVHTG